MGTIIAPQTRVYSLLTFVPTILCLNKADFHFFLFTSEIFDYILRIQFLTTLFCVNKGARIMTAERQRHAEGYDDLRTTVAKNLSNLIKVQKDRGGTVRTREDLADELGVTVSTIHRWCNGSVLPGTDYIVAIAQIFGVSIDDLLSEGGIQEHPADTLTYSKLLWTILDLESEAYFSREGLGDPFIYYLYNKFLSIEQTPIQYDRKEQWRRRVYMDYDRPLLPLYLTQYIELFRWQFSEIEEYDTYLVVFNILQDYMQGKGREMIDSLIASWHENDDNNGVKFPVMNVPWLNKRGHSIIYKAQKRNPRRSKYSFDLAERRKDAHGEPALPDETDIFG